MQIDYTAWRFWFDFFQVAGTLGIAIYVWLINKHKATNSRIDRVEGEFDERLDKIADRVTVTELEIKHMPSRDDINRLNSRIEELHGDLHEIAGGVTGLRRAVDLMNEFLINQGSKK